MSFTLCQLQVFMPSCNWQPFFTLWVLRHLNPFILFLPHWLSQASLLISPLPKFIILVTFRHQGWAFFSTLSVLSRGEMPPILHGTDYWLLTDSPLPFTSVNNTLPLGWGLGIQVFRENDNSSIPERPMMGSKPITGTSLLFANDWLRDGQMTHFWPMGSERKLGIQRQMFHSNKQGELPTLALHNFSHAQAFYVSGQLKKSFPRLWILSSICQLIELWFMLPRTHANVTSFL